MELLDWNSTQMNIQIKFENPLAISQGSELDVLQLKISNESMKFFISKDMNA